MISVKVKGIKTVQRNILNLKERISSAVQQGVNEIADEILEVSRGFVPKDTTNLMNSSFVAAPNYSGKFAVNTFIFDDKRKDAGRIGSDYNKAYRKYLRQTAPKGKNFISQYSAKVVYSAYYALEVHEVPKRYNNGNWKYLESAANNVTYNMVNLISNKVSKVL